MNGDIMSISKDDLLKRRDELAADYDKAVAEIEKGESQLRGMRNNLNAMAGALQQTELFITQIEEDGDPMPEDKKFALDMATS
jgi:RecA/RadA recombinase